MFHDQQLIVVQLPDGEPGVVLRWICENVHIDMKAQIQRIKRTEVIADDLVYTRIQTDGGPQVLATLILRAVPYWLATIDTRRMEKDDPRRQEILDYQRNAVNALYAWASAPRLQAPANLVPDEQVAKPVAPGEGASLEEWRMYYQQMAAFTEWRMTIEEWRGSVEGRLESIEAIIPDILERLPPPTISIEHQTLVQYYVSELSKATNKTHATIYASLKTAFRVPRYDEIPESAWEKVERWFQQQMPGKKLPPTQEKLF